MFRAIGGCTGVFLIVAIFGLATAPDGPGGSSPTDGVPGLVLTVVALPAFIVWGLLEVMHALRPRRVFIGERRSSGGLIGWGVITGGLTVTLATLALPWLDRTFGDAVIFGSAAAASTLILFPLLPRRRRGRCVYCNHDQRGASVRSGGCCAECGRTPPV